MLCSLKCVFQYSKSLPKCRQMSVVATRLVYNEFGEPATVVKKVEEKLPDLKSNEVLVKVFAAPINPADINTIQGRYPIKPKFPAVAGNEFVGEILEVGSSCQTLKKGDRVVPFETGIGTWCSHGIYKEDLLMTVPKELGIIEAATINVNPPTAYRMLKEFVHLDAGRSCVIQNGANSAVGQAVFQLCKAWNYSCIGIVRNRPDIDELKAFLKSLGASEVLTEEECRSTQLFKQKKYPKPKLALNCVGGQSATQMFRHLSDKSVIVTYGGMSQEPVTIPTSALIFKDVSLHGFWMTRWSADNHSSPLRRKMFDELIDLMLKNKFKGPVVEEVTVDNYQEALSFQGFAGRKFVLKF